MVQQLERSSYSSLDHALLRQIAQGMINERQTSQHGTGGSPSGPNESTIIPRNKRDKRLLKQGVIIPPSGYMNDEFGLEYMKQHFEPYSREIVPANIGLAPVSFPLGV